MSLRAELPHVTIYTDGGADPNPGPGGWGAILVCGQHRQEKSGARSHTTNNRMELTAAISALEILGTPCIVDLYTDSQYLRKGITQWIEGWRSHGWRTRSGSPVRNVDLWKKIAAQADRHHITWHWVRGHAGNPLNERADALAREAREAAHPLPDQELATAEPDGDDVDASQLPQVTIYARGSALGVPGPAGYAALLLRKDAPSETVRGGWPLATSNHAELWAVVAALRRLREPCRVTVYSGSKYVLDGARSWLAGWERNGWRTRSGGEVKNREMWQELAHVMGDHNITWVHLPASEASEQSAAVMRIAREEATHQKAGNARRGR